VKQQATKREANDRRAKRAQAATAMGQAPKSRPPAIPVPMKAKRVLVKPVGRRDK
jgi:hypothetical protein